MTTYIYTVSQNGIPSKIGCGAERNRNTHANKKLLTKKELVQIRVFLCHNVVALAISMMIVQTWYCIPSPHGLYYRVHYQRGRVNPCLLRWLCQEGMSTIGFLIGYPSWCEYHHSWSTASCTPGTIWRSCCFCVVRLRTWHCCKMMDQIQKNSHILEVRPVCLPWSVLEMCKCTPKVTDPTLFGFFRGPWQRLDQIWHHHHVLEIHRDSCHMRPKLRQLSTTSVSFPVHVVTAAKLWGGRGLNFKLGNGRFVLEFSSPDRVVWLSTLDSHRTHCDPLYVA
jgi:hypothetical protein